MLKKEQDPMGQAIYNYYHNGDANPILVDTNITSGEELPVEHLFRSYHEMPHLEKKALELVKGKVLDIGAGAGAHSLHLQKSGYNVTAMDISELSCEVMTERGVENVICGDVWNCKLERFDTILLMMNGIGLVKNLEGLSFFFEYIKQFLNPSGQILLDSSDLKYMYDGEDVSELNLTEGYYGCLHYHLSYKDSIADPFPWLFVDFENLRNIAVNKGWDVELIYEDEHFHYLAKLTLE